MPSLETARRITATKNNGAKTLGQIRKEQSDFLMEQTWMGDIQSKICYIYDYFHDDQKDKKDHMTYVNTTKTKIDAKFIVKSKQSLDKDQVEYYVQFKPSQKTKFVFGDDLYYFETDYRNKYGNNDFVGLYLDIPDDKNIYHKWIIVKKEVANQFVKYLVLPCDYEFMWIERKGQEKIKRRMWAVLRSQNSYNSGLWAEYYFTTTENQKKCMLPLNSITEKIWYTNETSKNMRVLVSAFTNNPIAWTISKVENANDFGIQTITLYQDFFNENKDYIEKDDNGKIIGLWADYYDYNESSLEPTELATIPSKEYLKISATTPTLKVGGSYKTLTVNIFDSGNIDVTDCYSDAEFNWSCSLNGEDFTTNSNVKWLTGNAFNKTKIKFSDNRNYLNNTLIIKCIVKKDAQEIESNIQLKLGT